MAKTVNTSGISDNTFSGTMNQDVRHFGMKSSDYIMARNAINKSSRGDSGSRITEPANVNCTYAPFVIIGADNLEEDKWIIFSTNNITSEIGIFQTKTCFYQKIARDECMGFRTSHLITAVSRPAFDGSFNVYFDDFGLNVSRMFNTRNFPFIQDCTIVNNCQTCVDTEAVDCDKLRLEFFIDIPCISLSKGSSVGSMLNGSYTAFTAYLINGQRVSDYVGHSNIQSIFDHSNINSSIEIALSGMDTFFDEFELVVLSVIAEKTVARRVGVYSTRQTKITLDFIDNDLPIVSLSDLPLVTPVPDRSEGMFKIGKYLTRINPSNKFEFNYQPLANQIGITWQSVEYPANYYQKGGSNVGLMRDEVYPFFIRWLWNTGDKTVSYHIPGRYRTNYTLTNDAGAAGPTLLETDVCPATANIIESGAPKVFEVFNTAILTATPNTLLPDGGKIVAEGLMGYHESTELYDDNHGEVWNANIPGFPDYDLCGQPIRHHRMPDNILVNAGGINKLTNHFTEGGNFIRILGIKVNNVQPPLDNDGNVIQGIVGYEILRGSRNGEKTVLFKGMINNMYEYGIPKSITGRKGLYANYPFNDLRPDKFISKNPDPVTYEPAQGGLVNYDPNDQVSLKNFTFHSPDTTFAKPFLEADELKIYGGIWGMSRGYYHEPPEHPRHKFVTDLSFVGAIVVGFGYAISKMNGTRDVTYPGYETAAWPVYGGSSTTTGSATAAISVLAVQGAGAGINNTISIQGVVDALTGQNDGLASLVKTTKSTLITTGFTNASIPTSGGRQAAVTYSYRDQDQTPGFVKLALSILGNPMFLGYMSDGADTFLELIRSVGSWRQYVVQYQAYCGYENMYQPYGGNRRRALGNSRYLDDGFYEFGSTHLINHKYRNETVVFSTDQDVQSLTGAVSDNSRPELMSELPADKELDVYLRRAASHYVAFKSINRNQYGQLHQIVQIPATTCPIPADQTSSGVIFGGDTYIGRYSEKNTLFYFDQWLNGEPDGAIHNYFKHKMFEHTAFWMDTDPFDLMEFVQSVPQALGDAIAAGDVSTFFSSLVTPSDKHCFDRLSGGNGVFLLKKAFMYLFQSGVRDFFVESEYNIDFRDWEDSDDKKHWPVLSDLKTMFNLDNIKADNYYKFDRSLAVSFLAQSKINWADLQQRNYNPVIAQTVFTKRNRRVIYSLPQETAAKKDNFSVFLPLNYKDFTSDITCIKPIGRTAGLIFFKTEPPGLLPGIDELQTTGGAKVTIGDGSLFSREMQRLDSSEPTLQFGSCQNRLSVVNTPIGIFYMSVDQGEIFFTDGNSLKTLSNKYLRRWLNLFLPYKLIKDFPQFQLIDNPVVGIGCQSSYMTDTGIVYFCKKDYVLRKDLSPGTTVTYEGSNNFLVNGNLEIKLGDPRFFENASWTLSWDVAEDCLVSFHDWHPDLILPGPNVFHTTKRNGIWKHNAVCNLFCNYYGVDYPFEIQYLADTKFQVNTLRSIEYYLEAYIYGENCYDRYHVLNQNFSKAVLFNSEQVSGVLNLVHDNGKDPEFTEKYPIIHNNSIDILFSKEEQKYRFNQFWDITRDRGEFSNVKELIWNTTANGYIKILNPNNLNYHKEEIERKKFRHHNNEVWLIKENNANVETVVNLSLLKNENSAR